MQPPMFGSWSVLIRSARPFSIHGDVYYELLVQRDDEPDGAGTLLKVPNHAVDGEPTAGERVAITFLMGQVTSVKREPM